MLQNLELPVSQTLRGEQTPMGPEPSFPGSWIPSLKQQGHPQHGGCPGNPCLNHTHLLQETPGTGGADGYGGQGQRDSDLEPHIPAVPQRVSRAHS